MIAVKLFYYALWVLFLVYKLWWLQSAKERLRARVRYYEYAKNKPTIKWNDAPEDIQASLLRMYFIEVPAMFMMLTGLFTYNWILFVVLIPVMVIRYTLADKLQVRGKFYNTTEIIWSVCIVIMIVFNIVNTFHLKIDLYSNLKTIF